jgi:hypothetical protein
MVELFFRDGRPYSGIEGQQTFRPVKGEAVVHVYPPCPRCAAGGSYTGPNGVMECLRCNGSGHELRIKAVRVYTKERLTYLNKRARCASISSRALKETKREFSQFLRDRGMLVERIEANATQHADLQSFYATIQSGSALSPSQIRRASEVLRTLRK